MDCRKEACVGPKDAQASLGRSSGFPGPSRAVWSGRWAREGPRRHGGRALMEGSASKQRCSVRWKMEARFGFPPQKPRKGHSVLYGLWLHICRMGILPWENKKHTRPLLAVPGTEHLNFLSAKCDRTMSCSNEVTLGKPLESFRMVSEPPTLGERPGTFSPTPFLWRERKSWRLNS